MMSSYRWLFVVFFSAAAVAGAYVALQQGLQQGFLRSAGRKN